MTFLLLSTRAHAPAQHARVVRRCPGADTTTGFQEVLVMWLLSLADCHQSRVGRSSDSRARAARPSRRVCPKKCDNGLKRLGCPFLLGYSGGAVPDSHRIPCLSALQMKRPTTNAPSNVINLPRLPCAVKCERNGIRNSRRINDLRSPFVRPPARPYSLAGASHGLRCSARPYKRPIVFRLAAAEDGVRTSRKRQTYLNVRQARRYL
jgi:hypothetical protein